MRVKYIGAPDQITTDYNGRRYVFNKSAPILDIPLEVFRHIQRESSGILAEYVMPFESEPKAEEKIILPQEVKETKRPGRPKKR